MSHNSKAPNSTRAKRRRRRRNLAWIDRALDARIEALQRRVDRIRTSRSTRVFQKATSNLARAVGPAVAIMRQCVLDMKKFGVRIDSKKLQELAEKYGTDNSK